MTSQVGFLAYAALQLAVIWAVFVALHDLCKRVFKLDDLLAFCATVLALGVLGYLMFWVAYASYTVFGIVKIALLAALLIWFGVIAFRRRLGDYRFLAEPLLYTTLFAAIVLTLGFSNGGLDNFETPQSRFSELLPQDNLIPWIVAEKLKSGRIPSPLFGNWLASDRPPLQTGLYLFLNVQRHELAYHIVSVWLQASFLLGVWGVAVAARMPTAVRRLMLLGCCLLPTALINTFYVWPKMLAVDFLLLVFALLFCRQPENDRERVATGMLIGGLTTLSVLSHGSSLFALIGFAVVVLAFWAWPPLKSMIYGGVTLVALYLPWMVYQAVADPPANRLLKWHFAGVPDVDARTFLAALRDQYGALTLSDYLQGRLTNLMTMIGSWPRNLADLSHVVVRQDAAAAVDARGADFFQLLPSLHYFSLALIAALALLIVSGGDDRAQRKIAMRLLVAVAASCAALCILEFIPGLAINHVGSYATQVMLTMFVFMVLSWRASALAIVFIAVQTASVATLYAFTLPRDPAFWLMQGMCVAAVLVMFGYSLWPRFVGWVRREAP